MEIQNGDYIPKETGTSQPQAAEAVATVLQKECDPSKGGDISTTPYVSGTSCTSAVESSPRFELLGKMRTMEEDVTFQCRETSDM